MDAAATAPAKTPFPAMPSRTFLAQAAVLVGLAAFLYYSTLGLLVNAWWTDPNFSHGFFVPLFSGLVIWQRREQLALVPVRPSWWGLLFAALSLAVLVLGTLGAELFLARASLVLLIGSLIIYFL